MVPACNNSTGIPKAATVLLAAALLSTGAFMWSGAAPVEAASRALQPLSESGGGNATRAGQPLSGWEGASPFRGMTLVDGNGARSSPSFVCSETFPGDNTAGPYILSRSAISKDWLSIYRDGVPVLPSKYIVDEATGGVLFFHPLPAGGELKVLYRYSQAGRQCSSLDLASSTLALLPLSQQVRLGILYTEGKADPSLSQVKGAMAQYDLGGLLFKGGLFTAAPTANTPPPSSPPLAEVPVVCYILSSADRSSYMSRISIISGFLTDPPPPFEGVHE